MKTHAKRWLITPAVILVALIAGGAGFPEGSDGTTMSGDNGLWRDMDGGYWCGGDCGPGQRCCTITMR
ncbi:MAG TPA: hypothetical protein VHG28_21645 [Longimicrobiaceae bacterium]|nr:hypothetical protein [Longimicrobiaceae bacterium]